jgi:large subunit ribosomal protein L9
MKVLFKKDVADVAKAGQVKDVADGYARNFLIPRGFAVVATSSALKQVADLQAVAARHAAEEEQAARQLKARLEAEPVVIEAKAGTQGRLYGSVTTADVATAIQKQLGTAVERRDLEIPEPVRQVGA